MQSIDKVLESMRIKENQQSRKLRPEIKRNTTNTRGKSKEQKLR